MVRDLNLRDHTRTLLLDHLFAPLKIHLELIGQLGFNHVWQKWRLGILVAVMLKVRHFEFNIGTNMGGFGRSFVV